MTEVVRTTQTIAFEINCIKRQTANYCLNSALEIGKLLVEAKQGVNHGEWGKWLETNVDYSVSNANNLMKLYNTYGEKQQTTLFDDNVADIFGALAPSKALALTALPEEKRIEYVQTHDVENESVKQMQEEINKIKAELKEKNEKISKLNNDLYEKNKSIASSGALKTQLEAEKIKTQEANKKAEDLQKDLKAASERAEVAEKELKAMTDKEASDYETVRKEFEEEIFYLKDKLKKAQSSDTQKFAVHFELFQTEFNELMSVIENLKSDDKETAEKFTKVLSGLLESFGKRCSDVLQ